MSTSIRNGMPATQLVGAEWRKSNYSGQLGNCIEAAVLKNGDIALRNSRYPGGPALIFTHEEIAAFLAGTKDGEFDDFAS